MAFDGKVMRRAQLRFEADKQRRADEFACSALYREFLALTDAMIPAPAAEAAVVSDPYGGEV